jgi:SNF2 family DNA or RNA helicase
MPKPGSKAKTVVPKKPIVLPPVSKPACYDELLRYRKATNASLKPCPYLKESVVLRYYQVIGVLHLIKMTRMVLGDGTGLGKTVEMISAYCYLLSRNPNLKLIVVSPKSATSQWVDEFAKFTVNVDARRLENYGPKSRRDQYEDFWTNPARNVLVMHYHWFREDLRVYEPFIKGDFMVVFDEATAFKNHQSKTHAAALEVSRKASRCYGLTATLLKNNLIEGFGIYRVIHQAVFNTGITGFKARYCVEKLQEIGARKIPVVVGYKNVEHFRASIDPYFLGRAKYEVSKELPDLITKEVPVGLSDAQWEAYGEALEGLLTVGTPDGEKVEKEVTPLAKLIYCQQIVNSPDLIGREGSSEKENELFRLLDDEFEGEKTIIFSRFKKMVNRIEKLLGEKDVPCLRITGDEDEEQRNLSKLIFQEDKEAITRWAQKYLVPKDDPREEAHRKSVVKSCHHLIMMLKNKVTPKIMLLTPAGTEALNLQSASVFIFYDSPWSPGDYEQLLGRMIRIGSVHASVIAVHLVCKGTIDDHVLMRLKEKAKTIKKAMGETTKGALTFEKESDIGDIMEKMKADAIRIRTMGRKALRSEA